MNLATQLDQFREENVYFCESIRNNIMTEGNFIRILYSNQFITFNGVYLLIHLLENFNESPSTLSSSLSHFNKFKCTFNTTIHKEIINQIKVIEDSILSKVNIINKTKLYKIHEQLCTGNVKLFTDTSANHGQAHVNTTSSSSSSFILKISGIWETKYQYGLTFKFLPMKEIFLSSSSCSHPSVV